MKLTHLLYYSELEERRLCNSMYPHMVNYSVLQSMTELNSVGAFQRGVEERRQLYSHNNYGQQVPRGGGIRPPTAVKPSIPPANKPLSNAWSTESQKPEVSVQKQAFIGFHSYQITY